MIQSRRVHVLLPFLALAGLATGQDFRAKIQGRVVDASQAVIPSATITLLNTSTGVRTTRQTNDYGARVRRRRIWPGGQRIEIGEAS